jgi:hypothetical protein
VQVCILILEKGALFFELVPVFCSAFVLVFGELFNSTLDDTHGKQKNTVSPSFLAQLLLSI